MKFQTHAIFWWYPVFVIALLLPQAGSGQDDFRTPSAETKAKLEKLNKTPAAVSDALKGVAGKVAEAAKSAVGVKPNPRAKKEPVDLNLPNPPVRPYPAPINTAGTRDPFKPFKLETKAMARPRESLSPLERYELGQLKIVGIVWDIKEPRAMLEDPSGLGYVVTKGMPIGSNEGVVKSIHREGIVVEEMYNDVLGVRKKREVPMKLATE